MCNVVRSMELQNINRRRMIWGSHSGRYEEIYFLDITPHSPLEVNVGFGATYHLYLQGWRINRVLLATSFMLVSSLTYSSILKIMVICSTETSVDFQRTTHRYVPFNNRIIWRLNTWKEICWMNQTFNYSYISLNSGFSNYSIRNHITILLFIMVTPPGDMPCKEIRNSS
jgi:hypothetical protein